MSASTNSFWNLWNKLERGPERLNTIIYGMSGLLQAMKSSSRDDIVQKKVSELSRDAEDCKEKLISYLEQKYLPRYGRDLLLASLSSYAQIMHQFLVKMGERDEAELAFQMSGLDKIGYKRSQQIDALMMTLSEDDNFACGGVAGISMYIAVLALIKRLLV